MLSTCAGLKGPSALSRTCCPTAEQGKPCSIEEALVHHLPCKWLAFACDACGANDKNTIMIIIMLTTIIIVTMMITIVMMTLTETLPAHDELDMCRTSLCLHMADSFKTLDDLQANQTQDERGVSGSNLNPYRPAYCSTSVPKNGLVCTRMR